MRKIALAAAIGITLAASALAGAENTESNARNCAKFNWTVYNAEGKTVQSKTGTKTFREQGDWLYNGVHRSKYSWELKYGALHVDHHYYGNKWTLWFIGDRTYVGHYTGKKDEKSDWTCRMKPVSEQEWKDWMSLVRENRAEATKRTSRARTIQKTGDADESGSIENAQKNKPARDLSFRIIDIRNRGKVLRGRWVQPKRTRGRWVQVTLRVVNKSNTPLTYVPFHLVDKQGRTYNRCVSGSMYIRETQPWQYQPGVPAHRTLIFEVAAGARPDHVEIRGVTF